MCVFCLAVVVGKHVCRAAALVKVMRSQMLLFLLLFYVYFYLLCSAASIKNLKKKTAAIVSQYMFVCFLWVGVGGWGDG